MLASLLQGWGEGRGESMEVDKRKECVCGGGGEDKESHCNMLKVRANIPQKDAKFHPA